MMKEKKLEKEFCVNYLNYHQSKTILKLDAIWSGFIERHSILAIILTYNVVIIIGGVLFYFLFPVLLNYPPSFSEIANKYSLSYLMQFSLIVFAALLVGSIFYFIVLKGIDKRKNVDNNSTEVTENQAIRRKCLNLPYIICIAQIIIPILFFLIVFPFVATLDVLSAIFILKIIIMIFSMMSLTSIISLIFSRKLFIKILLKTDARLKLEGIRIKLQNKIFLQIVPMIVASILVTSLIGYSRLIEEKGNLLYRLYKVQLVDVLKKTQALFDEDQIKRLLSKVKLENNNEFTFIVTPEKQIITSNGIPLNKIFTIYLFDYFTKYNGHIYDATGETQGAAIKLKGIDGEYIVGIKYEVVSSKAALYFLVGFIALFIINILILSYFSKSIASDISLVADNLSEIAEGTDVNLEKRIPVTSNDEIGNLVIAFNKIQDREKQHIKQVKENQQILLERERLATLGQMFVGITHNLRSPIMSIAGGLEALKELIKEYEESIDNDNVTKADHHEIAREMNEWFESTKPYCIFMSDLISAVREQVIPLNTSILHSDFTIEELVKRIELLLKYELKKNHCIMETDIQVDFHTTISGEVNNLVQVCNNLIMNAIQAYDGNGGKIEFRIAKQENRLLLIIKDYGKGMPSDIQNKIFHQIITTKGVKRTGLGLYMSYLAIKGCFRGDLYFESKENEGTTFYISVPYQTEIVEDDGEIKVL